MSIIFILGIIITAAYFTGMLIYLYKIKQQDRITFTLNQRRGKLTKNLIKNYHSIDEKAVIHSLSLLKKYEQTISYYKNCKINIWNFNKINKKFEKDLVSLNEIEILAT